MSVSYIIYAQTSISIQFVYSRVTRVSQKLRRIHVYNIIILYTEYIHNKSLAPKIGQSSVYRGNGSFEREISTRECVLLHNTRYIILIIITLIRRNNLYKRR